METRAEENNQADRPTIPVQNNTRNPHDQRILAPYQRIRGKGEMRNMQQNGIDEPHINTMQRKEHTDHMATSESPMATLKHPMARNHPRYDPRMRQYNPTPEQTKEE